MKDWRFLLAGLVWLVLGVALLARLSPLVGVPVWAIQGFGIIALGGAALFFYCSSVSGSKKSGDNTRT
jgi:hypothetical protein